MSTIRYLGYFDFQDSNVQRNYPLACTNKMESIAESIIEAGYNVEIISTAVGVNDRFFIASGETIRKSDKLSARFFPTLGGKNRILRAIRRVISDICLLKFLLFELKKREPLIVYHSFGFRNILIWAKKIRKFQLILELEEIYHDALPMSEKAKRWELETISIADAYLFPTELLNKKFNIGQKPYGIILGTYHVEPQITQQENDGKIHVVYAGTFDPRKGGALSAAAAAAELPDNYVFHICGFGSKEETDAIIKMVDDINLKHPGKAVFHGTLKGREYISLLQKCHIGLSTQNPEASFNATSFPSKILSYMANGLEVVTVDIPAVSESRIGSYLHYYHIQEPKRIAEAICNVKLGVNDTRKIIGQLYNDFVSEIGTLLKNTDLQ